MYTHHYTRFIVKSKRKGRHSTEHPPRVTFYSPLNSGLRFSLKAAMPSAQSLELKHIG